MKIVKKIFNIYLLQDNICNKLSIVLIKMANAEYPFGELTYTPWNYSITEDIYSKKLRTEYDYNHMKNPDQEKTDGVYTGPVGWDRLERGEIQITDAVPLAWANMPSIPQTTVPKIDRAMQMVPEKENFTTMCDLDVSHFVLIALLIAMFYFFYVNIVKN